MSERDQWRGRIGCLTALSGSGFTITLPLGSCSVDRIKLYNPVLYLSSDKMIHEELASNMHGVLEFCWLNWSCVNHVLVKRVTCKTHWRWGLQPPGHQHYNEVNIEFQLLLKAGLKGLKCLYSRDSCCGLWFLPNKLLITRRECHLT